MNSPAKTVEHHIHALPAGGLAERLDEIQGARGGDVLRGHTQALQHMVFAGVGGGENLAPRWPAIWMAA